MASPEPTGTAIPPPPKPPPGGPPKPPKPPPDPENDPPPPSSTPATALPAQSSPTTLSPSPSPSPSSLSSSAQSSQATASSSAPPIRPTPSPPSSGGNALNPGTYGSQPVAPDPSHKTGLTAGAAAGIGIGIALAVILLALAAFLLFLRRRKKRKSSRAFLPNGGPAPDAGVVRRLSRNPATSNSVPRELHGDQDHPVELPGSLFTGADLTKQEEENFGFSERLDTIGQEEKKSGVRLFDDAPIDEIDEPPKFSTLYPESKDTP